MTTVVFNRTNIANWKRESAGLHAQMQGIIPLINQEQAYINAYNNQLSPLQSQINSVQFRIDQIKQDRLLRNSTYYHPHHHGHHHGFHHQGHFHPHYHTYLVWDPLSDLSYSVLLNPLNQELNDLCAQRNGLMVTLGSHSRNLQVYQEELSRYQGQFESLQKNIPEGEKFLDDLEKNPNDLIIQLKNKISSQFALYDRNHPVDLPPEVRLCLSDSTEKLEVFSPSNDPRTAQINYLKLCAFIYQMDESLSATRAPSFKSVLNGLVYETHLTQDLPEALATNTSLKEQFSLIKSARPELFNVSTEQLIQREQETYAELQKYFPCTEKKGGSIELSIAINSAYRTINKEILFKESKNQVVDYHFYNKISKLFIHLNNNPMDQKAIQDLAHITNFASGKPSMGKKILGGIAIVLGVLLLITGFVLMGLACANCPPLALGLGLAMQGVLGAATALVGITTGLASSFFGRETIKGKDLFRKLTSVNKEFDDLPKPKAI